MMTNEGLNKVIAKIADEVVTLAQIILEDDSIFIKSQVGKKILRDSVLKFEIPTSTSLFAGGDTVIKVLFNNYITYIEQGRAPRTGKKLPISALKDWADNNGIPSDNNILWAISTILWRDGYAGPPIFATLENEIDKMFDKEWAEQIFNSIVEQLESFFVN